MALNFPNPADTQIFTAADITWTWNATLGVWSAETGTGFDETVADERYLKLDASNDPVTGTCEFAAGVQVTGGDLVAKEKLYVDGESYVADRVNAGADTLDNNSLVATNNSNSSSFLSLNYNGSGVAFEARNASVGTDVANATYKVFANGVIFCWCNRTR